MTEVSSVQSKGVQLTIVNQQSNVKTTTRNMSDLSLFDLSELYLDERFSLVIDVSWIVARKITLVGTRTFVTPG